MEGRLPAIGEPPLEQPINPTSAESRFERLEKHNAELQADNEKLRGINSQLLADIKKLGGDATEVRTALLRIYPDKVYAFVKW